MSLCCCCTRLFATRKCAIKISIFSNLPYDPLSLYRFNNENGKKEQKPQKAVARYLRLHFFREGRCYAEPQKEYVSLFNSVYLPRLQKPTRTLLVSDPNPDRSGTSSGQPSFVLPRRTILPSPGGPPAATVSRDVSFCPTWKQKPHRHLLLPMGFESIPLLTESTRPGCKFLKSSKSKSSSRLASMANRFENLVLATAQKRIGSALTSSRFCVLVQSSFEKTFSRIGSRETRIDLRKTLFLSVRKRIGSPQIRIDSKHLTNISFSEFIVRVDSIHKRIDLSLKLESLPRNESVQRGNESTQ
ncbi:hypothetical protein PIB30_054951 [Stylosanthes scabra]|uniref:Uncharacterized protein n=1 Tax=Stylosanthes scabra TaxID=79078 RepID=A0ABU6QID4_9FABA|nr:hypothetical protein [Stylosanthes scabra]